jgi:N-acetylmuramoyl-L-alanine amidase
MRRSPLTISRRAALSLLAASAASLPFRHVHAQASFAWDVVNSSGRDYVTAQNIKDFYHFSQLELSGNHVWLKAPNLVLKARVGSHEILINNVKFILSFPVIKSGNRILVSRMDLAKLIDPVLRPDYISDDSRFETVIVDPGHGGSDSGARSTLGAEKDYALDLGIRLTNELKRRSIGVTMTRETDKFVSLADRVTFANRIPNSVFISLHFNSGGSAAQGIETFALSPQGTASIYGARSSDSSSYRGNLRDSQNIALATAVHASVLYQLRGIDRGIKRARWAVLRGIERPGILFEGGFLSNAEEARRIHSTEYRERLADAIAKAVVNYRSAIYSR